MTNWSLNYHFANHKRDIDKAYTEITLRLPHKGSTPVASLIDGSANKSPLFGTSKRTEKQNLDLNLSLGVPLFDGFVFADYYENLNFGASTIVEEAQLSLDTVMNATNRVLLNGGLNSSMDFQFQWKSLSMGYQLKTARNTSLTFQIHKHWVDLNAESKYTGFVEGQLEHFTDSSSSITQIYYSDSLFQGRSLGQFSGDGWSPEVSIQLGWFRIQAKMDFTVTLNGNFELLHQTPFFIDNLTLNSTISNPNDFFIEENYIKTLSREYETKTISNSVPIEFKFPQFYSFEFEFMKNLLLFSYTKTIGSMSLRQVESDTTQVSAYYLPAQSFMNIKIDHITMLHLNWKYFNTHQGFYSIQSSSTTGSLLDFYKQNTFIEDTFDYTIIPIWYVGFSLGDVVQFHLKLDILPERSYYLGAKYEF